MKYTLILLLVLCTVIQAKETLNEPDWSVYVHPTAFRFGLSGGTVKLLGNRVGIQAEGSVRLWDHTEYNRKLGYCGVLVPFFFHFREKHRGISAPYITPLIRYVYSEQDVYGTYTEYDDYGTIYSQSESVTRYTERQLTLGASLGRRWIIGKHFDIGFRVGWGFSPLFKTDWGEYSDSMDETEVEDMERSSRIRGNLDLTFHTGFSF